MHSSQPSIVAGILVSACLGGCGLVKLNTTINGKTTTYGGGSGPALEKPSGVAVSGQSPSTGAASPALAAAPASPPGARPPEPSRATPAGRPPRAVASAPAKAARAPGSEPSASPQALPTIAQADAKMKDKADREAAYQVLRDYMAFRFRNAMALGLSVPDQRALDQRINEFDAAQRKLRPATITYGLSPQAEERHADPAFQLKVLEQVVSPTAAAEFERSQEYRDAVQAAQAAAQQRATRAVLGAVAADRKPGVDRGVFGIQLGEELKLPACSNEMNDATLMSGLLGGSRGVKETCWGDAAGGIALAFTQLATEAAGVTSARSKVVQVAVKLADTACPDWARVPGRCTVFVATLEGVALGATITVTPFSEGSANTITEQLNRKYGRQPKLGEVSSCVNTWSGVELARAQQRSWTLPGLVVRYDPLGFGNCQQGIIKVELDYLQRFVASESAARDASGPKL